MPLSIGYFGSPIHSAILLEKLVGAGFPVSFVVSNPDKPFGRKQILTPTPVKAMAEHFGIPTITSPKLKEDAVAQERILNYPVDIHIVYAYGSIIPENIFLFPKYKSINLHGSILPLLRGPSPVQTALLYGFPETGFSIQYLAKEVDSGDILEKESFPISLEDNTETLLERITEKGFLKIKKLLLSLESGEDLPTEKQNQRDATFCKKIKAEDRRIDFKKSALEIHNQVRAFFPDPLAFGTFREKRLIFRKTYLPLGPVPSFPPETLPGTLVFEGKKRLFCVAGDRNLLGIQDLQLEGKNPMTATEFLNGSRLEEGEKLV